MSDKPTPRSPRVVDLFKEAFEKVGLSATAIGSNQLLVKHPTSNGSTILRGLTKSMLPNSSEMAAKLLAQLGDASHG